MTEEERRREFEEFEAMRAKELEATVGRDRRNSAISGVTEGVVGSTIGLPGDVNQILENVPGYKQLPWILKGPGALLPTTRDMTKFAQDKTGIPFAHEPETKSGKYTKAITGGVSGNLLPTGKIPWLLRGVAGAAAGAGGEATQQATGDGWAGAGVNMLINTLLQSIAARKPQAVKALQDDLKSLGASDAEVAERLKAGSNKADDIEAQTGARPTLSQALPEKTSLSAVTSEVQASPSGKKIDQAMEKQLAAGQRIVGEQLDRTSQLPIDKSTENKILRAGDKTLKRPQEVARSAADRHYRAGKQDKMPVKDREAFKRHGEKESVKDIYNQEGEWVDFETQTAMAGKEKVGNIYDAVPNEGNVKEWKVQPITIKELVKQIYTKAEELDMDGAKGGKPFRDYAQRILDLGEKYPDGVPVGKLDVIQREVREAAIAAAKPGASDKLVRQRLAHEGLAGVINDAVKATSPAMARGKEVYSTMAQGYLNRVNESPLPEMFTDTARKSGRGDYSVMGQIISDNTRYGPKDIEFVAHNLRRADPEAFPALVKQVWNEKWVDATKNIEGRTPQLALEGWTNNVTGPSGSAMRKNYIETVKQVHLSRGATPEAAEAAARGADAVADALETFSRDRAGVGKIDTSELKRAAGANVLSAGAQSFSTAPTWSAGKAFSRALWKKTYEDIADALTSPDGAQKLIEISQFSSPRMAAEAFLRSLVQAENQGTNF